MTGHRVCFVACAAICVAAFSACFVVAADWPPAPPLVLPVDTSAASLPPSATATATTSGRFDVTLRYRPPTPVQSVALVGTFNDWNAQANFLRGPDAAGVYECTLTLGSGRQLYKFLVDGKDWRSDPQNPDGEPDGHSGQNSVLRLGRLAALVKSEARTGDGIIEGFALEHDSKLPLYFQALSMDSVLVRLRMLANDVSQVSVAVRDGQTMPMRMIDRDDQFSLYEAKIALPPIAKGGADATRTIEYTFVLDDGRGTVSTPQTYSATIRPGDIFLTPEWAKNAVWYQIMVDRFRNGDEAHDPSPVRPWRSEWFSLSDFEKRDGQTFYKWIVFDRMYGGDFAGLEQKLGYLKELGVDALYLNPVFQAQGHHKYNATNYLHIDDCYGGGDDYEAIAATEDLTDPATWKWTKADRTFLAFLKKAKSMGFRVILDGVWNHVGPLHPAFLDVKKNLQKSKYADWFDVVSWEPFKYNGWAGFDGLPAFRKSATGLASESFKAHIFNMTRRWMDPNGDGDPSDGIDGWRLDVPNEIPLPFWVEWREVVKSVNPDAYIVGEIWDRADQWLDGKHFDAVMNYQVAQAIVAWVFNVKDKISASEFDRRLRKLRLAYPEAASYVMQNLMNSHDTDRVASMAFNPDRAYDHGNRIQDNGPNYNNSKPTAEAYQKARLALLIQMTYIGAPMIYYGDEAGMWGADDPTCRKPMLWEDLEPYDDAEQNYVMKEHLAFYRSAIALRTAHAALRTGAFETLLADDAASVWAFARTNENERLVVVINGGAAEREVAVPLAASMPGTWRVVFGGEGEAKAVNGSLKTVLKPFSGIVYQAGK